ncbi:autotransporter assembly complex protein TamB [Ferrimonas gelatinilytica]|uniref:Translocation/assembly module TamB domain-containing protein n=1 Tax=Ferrimonas gelatinilytica TaxID=1255257 RepID=A0ABP9SHY1_9GAMM
MSWQPKIHRLLMGLGVVPLALLVILALLLGTPIGTRFALFCADRLLPMVSIEYRDGTLNRGVSLTHFGLRLDGVEVEVDDVQAKWRLSCLLKRELCAESVYAGAVSVQVDLATESQPEEEEAKPVPGVYSGIGLPIAIAVAQADLNRIDVRVDDMSYRAHRIRGQVLLEDTLLALRRVQLEQAEILIPLGGDEAQVAKTDDAETGARPQEEDSDWPLAQLPEVILPFELQLNDVAIIDSQLLLADQEHKVTTLRARGAWKHTRLALDDLILKHNWADLAGRFSMDFREDYPMNALLSGEIHQLPWLPELQAQPLSVRAHGGFRRLNLLVETKENQVAQLQGWLNLAQPDLPYQLQLQAERLSWPLSGEPDYLAHRVKLRSEGNLDDQRFALSGEVQDQQHPPLELMLLGQHDAGLLQIHHATVQSELGQALLQGSLDYRDGLRWQATLFTEQLDLSQLLPELDLKLDGQLISQGFFTTEDWQIAVSNTDLRGQLMGYPLAIRGAASFNAQWQGFARDLFITLNGTELTMDGGVNQGQWQMEGQLRAEQLSRWLPELTGNADFELAIDGPADNPAIQLRGQAEQLYYQALSLPRARLNAGYQPLDNHAYRLDLETETLRQANESLGQLQFSSTGSLSDQSAKLSVAGPYPIELALSGSLDQASQRWQGRWQRGAFLWPQWPWEMVDEADLLVDLAAGTLTLGAHCWRARGTELCFDDPALLGQQGALAARLNAQTAQLLEPWLPDRMQSTSRIEGNLYLNWQPGQLPRLTLALTDRDGEVLLSGGDGLAPTRLTWRKVEARLNLTPEGVHLDAAVDVNDEEDLTLNLNAGTSSPYALEGELVARQLDLGPYLAWFDFLNVAQGHLASDLVISGDLENPEVTGRLALTEGRFQALGNPTEVSELTVDVAFEAMQGRLNGDFMAGQGTGQLKGEIDWRQGFRSNLRLSGSGLELYYPPMVTITAAPDLNLALDQDRISIKGEVALSDGGVTIDSLPENAVQVSDDVIFIDSQAEEAPITSTNTELAIRILLGDNIAINALGMTGQLAGDLTLRQSRGQPPQMFGDVLLREGRFEAFGQKLRVDRGQVSFNGPTTLPNLDVEATREIEQDDVTVGVRITGTPNTPKLSLFSTPAMEQQEILSYLTRGQGLSSDGSANSGSSALLTSAALSLGVGTTGGVVSTIGEGLGLRDLALDTEGAGDDTQVTISGYVGSRMYFKYGVGVFDAVNELTLRYQLMQRLWLEAVNEISDAAQQSLDIYYSFDID